MSEETKQNKFPLHIYPEPLRSSLQSAAEKFNGNDDLFYSSVLVVLGLGLSNRFFVQIDETWEERSNLWLVNIGPSGVGKTPIFNAVLRGIHRYEGTTLRQHNEKYIKLTEIYKQKLKDVGSSIREKGPDCDEAKSLRNWLKENNLEEAMEGNDFLQIRSKKSLALYNEDGTVEGIQQQLVYNDGRSLLVSCEEFKGFYEKLNRASQGGGLQFFLKLFGYGAHKTTNASDEYCRYIPDKTVSLIGTSQIQSFHDVFQRDMVNNGLFFRFLFVFPEDKEILPNEFSRPRDHALKNYMKEFDNLSAYIFKGYERPVKRHKINIDEKAWEFLKNWRDKANEDYKKKYGLSLSDYRSTSGKMVSYIHRFAIIISRLRAYYQSGLQDNISPEKMAQWYNEPIMEADYHLASELVDYFTTTSAHLLEKLTSGKDPVFPDERYEGFYLNLPDQVKTGDMVGLIQDHWGIKKSKAYAIIKILKEKKLIMRQKDTYFKIL